MQSDEYLDSGMLPAFSQSCDHCGRVYTEAGPLTGHAKLCTKGKKRLAGALAKARDIYHLKKRPRVQEHEAESVRAGTSRAGERCTEQGDEVRDHEVNTC